MMLQLTTASHIGLPAPSQQKAGILKTGVPAFTVPQQTPEASKSLSDQAAVVGSTLRVVTPDELESFAASSAGGVAAARDELVALGLDGTPRPAPRIAGPQRLRAHVYCC